jgi:hypothetical protein
MPHELPDLGPEAVEPPIRARRQVNIRQPDQRGPDLRDGGERTSVRSVGGRVGLTGEVSYRDLERVREPNQGGAFVHLLQAGLDLGDVALRHAGQFRQGFLTQAAFEPPITDASACEVLCHDTSWTLPPRRYGKTCATRGGCGVFPAC